MYLPKFTITPEINSQIAEIERLRTIVERSRILPSREVVLRKRASIEATRSSTGIEGNPLNEREVERVLAGDHVGGSDRFVTEVVNYKKALSYIERLADGKDSFSVKNILAIHRLVMRNLLPKTKVGVFRKTPIYVVDIVGGKDILRYTGPQADSVSGLVNDLLNWLEQDASALHPVLVAGILHFEFVSIHPFADGNGRVTRLLTLLYLFWTQYAFRRVLVPDTYYFEDRKKYYAALNQASTYTKQRSADMTPWLTYFVDGFLAAAQEITRKITAVSVSGGKGEIVTLTADDYRIVDLIASLGKAGIDDIVHAVELPKRTVQRRLQYLTDNDVLRRMGRGPATTYTLKGK